MKNSSLKVLLLAFLLVATSCNTAKKTAEAEAAKKAAAAKAKPKPKKGDIQPYSKVVTKEAKTNEGLFKVHTLDGKYLYEIPDSLFDREMLMVTRVAKTAAGYGYGGDPQNEQVLR